MIIYVTLSVVTWTLAGFKRQSNPQGLLVLTVDISAGMELPSLMNKGENAGCRIDIATASITGVFRKFAVKTILYNILGEGHGALQETCANTASEI